MNTLLFHAWNFVESKYWCGARPRWLWTYLMRRLWVILIARIEKHHAEGR
jgi:hypothetical protein